MKPSDKVLDSIDLNRLCNLEDDQLEKVGEHIRDKHKENLIEFRKSFYSMVDEISEKFMTLSHAKELHKLSWKYFVSNHDIGKDFFKRYGKKKLRFLNKNLFSMGFKEYDFLGWALCVSASRRIKKKPESWANEPRTMGNYRFIHLR